MNTLQEWIGEMPGSRFLPANWEATEPQVWLGLSGEADEGQLVWRLFSESYQPATRVDPGVQDEADAEGFEAVYRVPLLVAEVMCWYSDGDFTWSCQIIEQDAVVRITDKDGKTIIEEHKL